MTFEEIKVTFSDGEFVKSLFELETVAQVRSALNGKGVELSEDEIIAIGDLMIKVDSGEITREQLSVWQQQTEDDELPEEMLAMAAGGFAISDGSVISILAALAATAGAYGVDTVVVEETGRHW